MKTPKPGQLWFDKLENKKFYIFSKSEDSGVYKPYDILYENNQTRYRQEDYIYNNCIYIGKVRIKWDKFFEPRHKKENNEETKDINE